MSLKLRHLQHPLGAARSVRNRIAEEWADRQLAGRGRRRFAGDPRYDLRFVTEGFADRRDKDEDPAILERICDAYRCACEREQSAAKAYRATAWWEQQRQGSLGEVIRALRDRDLRALQEMYGNFYRDPCSAGLILLQRRSEAYFGGAMKDRHRRLCLADALYRMEHWRAETRDRFAVNVLDGPETGNPFGVMVEGTLVRTGSEYQHYCAMRVGELARTEDAVVVEIGGGFGGMASYLLRDRPEVTYLSFDVPESVALMSYYLLRSFPEKRFLLCGESELTEEAIRGADAVLMPVPELERVPERFVQVAFSSHAMSDLSVEAMEMYLSEMARMTRGYFLFTGHARGAQTIEEIVRRKLYPYSLVERKVSGWHGHRVGDGGEAECLYRVGEAEHSAVEMNDTEEVLDDRL